VVPGARMDGCQRCPDGKGTVLADVGDGTGDGHELDRPFNTFRAQRGVKGE
jgi:hypothetical protein